VRLFRPRTTAPLNRNVRQVRGCACLQHPKPAKIRVHTHWFGVSQLMGTSQCESPSSWCLVVPSTRCVQNGYGLLRSAACRHLVQRCLVRDEASFLRDLRNQITGILAGDLQLAACRNTARAPRSRGHLSRAGGKTVAFVRSRPRGPRSLPAHTRQRLHGGPQPRPRLERLGLASPNSGMTLQKAPTRRPQFLRESGVIVRSAQSWNSTLLTQPIIW